MGTGGETFFIPTVPPYINDVREVPRKQKAPARAGAQRSADQISRSLTGTRRRNR
jgi:hypothetical protein